MTYRDSNEQRDQCVFAFPVLRPQRVQQIRDHQHVEQAASRRKQPDPLKRQIKSLLQLSQIDTGWHKRYERKPRHSKTELPGRTPIE